jgi:predicted ferric reductase
MEVPVLQISADKRTTKQQQALTLPGILLLMLAVVSGGLVAIFLLPAWLPAIGDSLSGTSLKAFWYLSRASAIVAYLFLWASMALGLGITNRLAFLWPGGPTTYSLHQYTGLLGLGFAVLHPLLLLGDHYINYTLVKLVVPFAGENYRQIGVGLGQIAIYLLALVSLSYYARKPITARWWRIIHTLSFATFLLILLHGIISGTDSTGTWAIAMYWLSGGSLLFLAVYRILKHRKITVNAAR